MVSESEEMKWRLKGVGSTDGDGPFGTRAFRGHDQGFLKGSRPEPLPVKKIDFGGVWLVC